MKVISKNYKRKLDKKIDALMDCVRPMTRRYDKKEVRQLVGVGFLMVLVGIYLLCEYAKLDDSARIMKTLNGCELLAFMWLEIYYIIGLLYNRFKTKALRNAYVVLGYVAIFFGSFFCAFLTLLEMFAQRTNLYYLYKHFDIVFMALPWTMIMTMISWTVLRALEAKYTTFFAIFDWNFVMWIFFYLVIKYGFVLCLKAGCRFFKREKEAARFISDEMGILFYIFLLGCMVYIWGMGILGTSENAQCWQGFLNATTVWLLCGTIQDKIDSGHEIA